MKDDEPESPCCTTTRTAINHKDNIAETLHQQKEGDNNNNNDDDDQGPNRRMWMILMTKDACGNWSKVRPV